MMSRQQIVRRATGHASMGMALACVLPCILACVLACVLALPANCHAQPLGRPGTASQHGSSSAPHATTVHATTSHAASQQTSNATAGKPLIIRRGATPQPNPQGPGGQAKPAPGPAFRAGAPPIVRSQPGNTLSARPGHLGEWMQQHQGLSPQQQQRALEQEPGFNQLPPEQQARMRARLQQLNSLPPEQRQQVLNRVESMERLTPEQRQQVTATMGRLRALPPDQKQQVTRAFAQIRRLPPEQREAAARGYDAQLNPQQREALHSLVAAEPYLPIQRPPVTRPQGYQTPAMQYAPPPAP